jgi:branched-chain amino acid aminotransferase
VTDSVESTLLSEESAGIFESLRTYRGKIFLLEEHLERFFESAQSLGLKIPETRAQLAKRVEKALKDSGKKEAFLRLSLAGEKLFVIVTERTHPAEIYEKGVKLKTSPVRRNLSLAAFPEAKTSSCLNQVLGTLDPAAPGSYEILFLSQEGYLTEARIGNLFLTADGILITPPTHGLLNGVTRRFVIKCARLGRISVEERPVTRHELFNAGEAFLTNTSWEILPVREVDGRKVGEQVPGPVTKKLQTLFRREVEREIRK